MRPKVSFYSALAALSVSGYVSGATGVGPFATIAGEPGDGTGHQVTLASTANLSAINMTLTGTDPEGAVLTETIAGPNNNTVTSTKYFKTIASVSAASTLGGNTMNIGWNAVCATPMYITNPYSVGGPKLTVEVIGTVTYTAQQMSGDSFGAHRPEWTTLGTASSTTTTTMSGAAGTSAIRVTVASHTSGGLHLYTSQGQ